PQHVQAWFSKLIMMIPSNHSAVSKKSLSQQHSSNPPHSRGMKQNAHHPLMCKQWWKVCFVYGDQRKYYRQLYGRRRSLTTLLGGSNSSTSSGPSAASTCRNHFLSGE
ncbi:Putative LOC100900085, partial [Caligus rogercresseyi]